MVSAYEYAREKHEGQTYPRLHEEWDFIEHCVSVADGFSRLNQPNGDYDVELYQAAMLHDVVEDSDATLDDIGRMFGKRVADIVDRLTRRSNETYREYIERVSLDTDATAIKLADLGFNIYHLLRPDVPTDKLSLLTRYLDAVRVLNRHK